MKHRPVSRPQAAPSPASPRSQCASASAADPRGASRRHRRAGEAGGAPRRSAGAFPAGFLALWALVAGCATVAGCAAGSDRVEVRDLVRRGQYQPAVDLSARLLEEQPDDPARQADARLARLALQLEVGRTAALEGRLDDARRAFEGAVELDPNSEVAARWLTKTMDMLAQEARERAKDAEAAGALEDAYLAYLESDRLFPSDRAGRNSAARVLLLMNHRDGLGDVYYLNGLRALRQLSLPEAQQQISAARKQRPGDLRTQDKLDEVNRMLGDERVRIGQELEREGLFRAARNEYRLALLYAPDSEEARLAMERVSAEVAVLDLLDEAARLAERGNFAMASARVERAAVLTAQQTPTVEKARTGIEERRRRSLYAAARELENDYRYEDAVAAYEELLAETGFYDDAISRRDTLKSYIETAERLYREASGEADTERRRSLLRQIQLFWPDYRDVRGQLEGS